MSVSGAQTHEKDLDPSMVHHGLADAYFPTFENESVRTRARERVTVQISLIPNPTPTPTRMLATEESRTTSNPIDGPLSKTSPLIIMTKPSPTVLADAPPYLRPAHAHTRINQAV